MSDRDFERDIERLRMVGKAPELAMGYCGDTVQYGRSPAGPWFEFNGTTDYLGIPIYKFNNSEGEKGMDKKIDWHKPLRALTVYANGRCEPTPGDPKVYTYKSGKQRVIWVEDRVYPVDEQGCAVADVDYHNGRGVYYGYQIVENVPEEKFFLGLFRTPDGSYVITDGGAPGTLKNLEEVWKPCFRAHEPHWIVDTRKSAAQPDPVKHDPEDWAVVYVNSVGGTTTFDMMTKDQAEAARLGPQCHVVRTRTTPPPADTARYIQLYRRAGTNEAWRINAFGKGRQEMTWAEAKTQARYLSNEHCVVKVRD